MLDVAPSFPAPADACDSHFHVFGPPEHYPYAGELRYAPPVAPLDEYMALARHLNLTRFVFVQPSAYGTDNRCMLDAMRQVGIHRCRGIVDLDESRTDPETLAAWHALGVRGIRVNVSPVRKPEPGLAEALRPRIRRLAALAADLSWHLDFLIPGWLVRELLPDLRALEIDFTLAHLGLFPARDGADQPGFREFLALLGSGARHCFVKLTGVYRISSAPDFADAAPLARALIEAAPDRLIWGSDFPHLSFADKVGSVALFNLLGDWAPSPALRRQILVENPAALFGFAD
ncbi:MAG TPA: amidohydrolase family protein [Acetobacteraceae bacterium]|nr:amidohydrolase family protein [Acetobacteraceae bacterium]